MESSYIFLIMLIAVPLVIPQDCTTFCCGISCQNCSVCTGVEEDDYQCCGAVILAGNRTCDEFDPPCIVVPPSPELPTKTPTSTNTSSPEPDSNNNDTGKGSEESSDFLDELEDFFDVSNIIMVSLIAVIVGVFIYSWTCFDRRTPAISYKSIIWKEGIDWVGRN